MISEQALKFADFTLKLVTIIGALFAAYQYLENREDLRISRTLEYVEKLDTPSSMAGQSYSEVLRTLNDYHKSIARFNDAKLSSEKALELRGRLLKGILNQSTRGINRENFKNALNNVVIFYDQLEICAAENLCDRRTAETFFQNDAKRLWKNFSTYFLKVREITPGYATGLKMFSGT